MKTNRGNRWFTAITVFIGIAIIAYLVFFFIVAMRKGITTAVVMSEVSYDSVSLTGIIVRDEVAVNNVTDSGFVYIVAEEGKRVSTGQPLAQSFTSRDAWMNSVKLHSIESQISTLTELLESNGTISASRLDSKIESSLTALRTAVADGDYRKAEDASNGLLELAMNAVNVSESLSRLSSEHSVISQSGYTTIGATESAFFSKYVDGYVGSAALQANRITSLDIKMYETIMHSELPQISAIGKIVRGQTWYYATEIEQSLAMKLAATIGQKVKLSFPNYGEFSMTVESVSEAYNGKNLVILSCNRMLQRMLSARFTDAELIFNEYSGIRVPRDALRLEYKNSTAEQAEPCVYVVDGPYMTRTFVEIIEDDDDYYIVKDDVYSSSGLHSGDSVIVTGTNLYDRKLISDYS